MAVLLQTILCKILKYYFLLFIEKLLFDFQNELESN